MLPSPSCRDAPRSAGSHPESHDSTIRSAPSEGSYVCRDCGLIFARRRQSAQSAALYYKWFAYLESRDYAEYPPKEKYLEGKSEVAAKHLQYLNERGLLFPGMTIAHVRCDVGSLQKEIQKQFPDCSVYGYDYFDSNVRYARESGLETVDLLNPAGIDFPHGVAFDLIICNHIFTHSIDPAADMEKLYAALKPGGILYLYNEMNHQIRFQPGNTSYQWVALNNFHKQLLSPTCLELFLMRGGFSDVTLSNDRNYMRAIARRNATDSDPDCVGEVATAAVEAAGVIEEYFRGWAKRRNSPFFSLFKLFGKTKSALRRQFPR